MQRHSAGDGAHGARPCAILTRGFYRRFNELGMRGQPEIVVRGQIDDLSAIEARFGGAGRFENTQTLVCARLPPGLELGAEVRERIRQFQTFSGMTKGARYFRVNIAVASASPLQFRFSASNSMLRPSR